MLPISLQENKHNMISW